MARLIDYSMVVHAAEAAGLRCVYPGGAAFAHAGDAHVVGWGSDDPTIRPQWREVLIPVKVDELARLARRAWCELFADDQAWIAPVHHWASELEHGVGPDEQDLVPLLEGVEIDAAPLKHRSKADAIAFSPLEADAFESFAANLMSVLWKSDFTLLFPETGTFATLHHHRQIWWRVSDAHIATRLRALPASF